MNSLPEAAAIPSVPAVPGEPVARGQAEHRPELIDCFERQRGAYLAHPMPSHAERVSDLRALHRLLVENRDALVEAVNLDFGNRSRFETLFAECFLNQEGILDAIRHLKKWMKPQRRRVDVTQYPLARARIIPQPVGVVGVVVPWNFPISMAFSPLTGILAAGNRAMVKMSENSPRLARLLTELSPKYLPEDKLRFFADEGQGPAFTSIPFDHLFFTGSPQTGKAVMASAARNLTPVTLELGGKSPAVVCPDYPLRTAVARIMWVKLFNAGQICTNVDYLFLPEERVQEFVRLARQLAGERYPDMNSNDYTSIIDERSYRRLETTLEDARAKGAQLINLLEGQRPDPALRKFPPHIILNPTDDMEVLQREIFGPLLPIRTYRSREEVAEYITARPRPLALYVYSNDKGLQDWYITHVMSGGVTINDGLIHAGLHSLPFGGIGNSGMGHYHGIEGFNTFSKMRPVFYQGPIRLLNWLMPPYGKRAFMLIKLMLRLKS
jgi:coniferyl-aldehyde dehydrogenase